MKNFFNIIYGILLISVLFPINVMAYNNWGPEVKIFSLYDVFFDVLGFSSAIVGFVIVLGMSRKFSGKLKSTWIYYMINILVFLILQVITLLSTFSIIDLSGIFSILKFFMGLFFLLTAFTAMGMVEQIIKNKSLRSSQNGAPIVGRTDDTTKL